MFVFLSRSARTFEARCHAACHGCRKADDPELRHRSSPGIAAPRRFISLSPTTQPGQLTNIHTPYSDTLSGPVSSSQLLSCRTRNQSIMFRHSVRRLAIAAARAPEPPTAYTLAVSKAQNVAKGLTGGEFSAITSLGQLGMGFDICFDKLSVTLL